MEILTHEIKVQIHADLYIRALKKLEDVIKHC